jgi:hypothetical protein
MAVFGEVKNLSLTVVTESGSSLMGPVTIGSGKPPDPRSGVGHQSARIPGGEPRTPRVLRSLRDIDRRIEAVPNHVWAIMI